MNGSPVPSGRCCSACVTARNSPAAPRNGLATPTGNRGRRTPSISHGGDPMTDRPDGADQAVEHDAPIPYMQRISTYYQTLGYGAPYRWAHFTEVPFAPLKKPLAESRLGLVTTAAPYQEGKGNQGPGAVYNAAAKFYQVYSGDTADDHDLCISHIGYDRTHTTAKDANTWFPLPLLREIAKSGRVRELA